MLSQGIFGLVWAVKKRISRFIIRISPLNRTCYGDLGEIVKLAKVGSYNTALPHRASDWFFCSFVINDVTTLQTVMEPAFSPLEEPTTWSIHLNRRNSGANRNDIIDGVAELVGKKHKVCMCCSFSMRVRTYIRTSEPV